MPHIFLYAHGGSGNHGCEAIVRSTCNILSQNADITLCSLSPEEDRRYGIGEACAIMPSVAPYPKVSFAFLRAYLALKRKGDYIPMDKLQYKRAFDRISKGDIALSIGGDNYCYANVQDYINQHDMLLKRGAKTVLWGCSIEPELLQQPQIREDLKRYSWITARESITYHALQAARLKNVSYCPDPAFSLPISQGVLPEHFIPGNTVGINISPMVLNASKNPERIMQNLRAVIQDILDHTDSAVALIPHVVWEDNDDRVPLGELYEAFRESNRVGLVTDQNAQQLKWVISQCSFFIGARTHATIAAYSTGVPTLVLGYSVKSKGIARDLFGDETHYVLPYQDITSDNTIPERFAWIRAHGEEIRGTLKAKTQEYLGLIAELGEKTKRLY